MATAAISIIYLFFFLLGGSHYVAESRTWSWDTTRSHAASPPFCSDREDDNERIKVADGATFFVKVVIWNLCQGFFRQDQIEWSPSVLSLGNTGASSGASSGASMAPLAMETQSLASPPGSSVVLLSQAKLTSACTVPAKAPEWLLSEVPRKTAWQQSRSRWHRDQVLREPADSDTWLNDPPCWSW